MKLSDLGEFGFISRIRDGCVVDASRVVKDIGDDCSVTPGEPGMLRLVTTDLLVERVHFLRDSITMRQLGEKAMAVNISDIAAMGGRALDAYISIAIPQKYFVEELDELYAGLKSMAGRFGVNLLGGDTTGSKKDLVINVVVTGEVEEDLILYRDGAKTGDGIYVTGMLGDSAGGLDAILKTCENETASGKILAERHRNVIPHLEEGRTIAKTKYAHSMIDVSDGLVSDLGHILDESDKGCMVDLSQIPYSEELADYCKCHQLDPVQLAISGGEDYVLLFTSEPGRAEAFNKAGVDVWEVGKILDGSERILVKSDGERIPMTQSGWNHFRSEK